MIEEELRASDSDSDEESSGEKTVIGSITIGYICRVLSDETTANPTDVAETCTFTLYREDGVTPISTRQLTISTYNYKSSSSVTFDNLNEEVYYLKEAGTTGYTPVKIKFTHTFLDTDGKWKKESGIQSGDGIRITINLNNSSSQSQTVVDIHKVDFTNIYIPVEKITITKKPSIKKPSASKNKITVSWKHFKNKTKKGKKIWKPIKKVQVQCATDSSFKNIIKSTKVGKKKTKTTIKGLKKKTTYYVRVRYYDGVGYSAWSKVKKVKTK